MIIPLNIKSENAYYKIFEAVKIAFTKLRCKYKTISIFIK